MLDLKKKRRKPSVWAFLQQMEFYSGWCETVSEQNPFTFAISEQNCCIFSSYPLLLSHWWYFLNTNNSYKRQNISTIFHRATMLFLLSCWIVTFPFSNLPAHKSFLLYGLQYIYLHKQYINYKFMLPMQMNLYTQEKNKKLWKWRCNSGVGPIG